LSTIVEIEAQGCRDSGLHAIADRLKGGHEVHGDPQPVRLAGP
jgi:hypothetical protein